MVDKKKCGISVNQIISEFEEENIETRRLWKPMHMQPIFKNNQFYGNGVSNSLFENGICLPSGSNIDEKDIKRMNVDIEKVIGILFFKKSNGPKNHSLRKIKERPLIKKPIPKINEATLHIL